MTTQTTQGSYQSTVTSIESNGYGDSEYRVKVTYNNGLNVSFLRSYDKEATAHRAAKRELAKISN